jgi:hypothetical protein
LTLQIVALLTTPLQKLPWESELLMATPRPAPVRTLPRELQLLSHRLQQPERLP